MIVDLIRNDLGKISKSKSVKVKELFHIEEYETIYQMTSQIKSELTISIRNIHFWESLFPGGSITGAPKISAMNSIEILESYIKRNLYSYDRLDRTQ